MADADQIRSRRIQYETEGLDVADVDRDPVAQWHHWYDQAIEAGLVEPEAMTVATVDADGRPDARIVLVRGVDFDGVVFFTIARRRARNCRRIRTSQRSSDGSGSIARSECGVRLLGSVTRTAMSISPRALAAVGSALGRRPSQK